MQIAELKAELERLHSASFGWALSCCRRDQTEAEEVLQTVYLKILEGKARFGGESSLKTWLFAVIRKTAATEYRRRLLRSFQTDRRSGRNGRTRCAPANRSQPVLKGLNCRDTSRSR